MNKIIMGAILILIMSCNQNKTKDGINDNLKKSSNSANIKDNLKHSRAVEAALWGIPIVASDAIRQGYLKLGANYNDIVYFSKPADWKFQTTTPNASTHYIYSAYSTKKDGPIVLEVPAAVQAGIYGQLCDMWDVPLAIVGGGGDDKGKGGKYLILPPDYNGNIPTGYFVVRQNTYGGFWLLRTIANSNSQEDQDAAISLLKKIRLYPLSKAANPPQQRFIDVYGKLWDGYPKMDETFYAILAKMVNEETIIPRDMAMMNILRSVGIEKGKEFKPDQETTAIFKSAIKEANDYINILLEETLVPYFWESTHWSIPTSTNFKTEFSFQDANMLDYDARALANFVAWAPPKKADKSAPTIYILSYSDKTGSPLVGGKTYRLHVPPNVPAKQYWSITVYDYTTACFIKQAPIISLDSYNTKTKKNQDGSVDIYFSPTAPKEQENNWVTTGKEGRWFVFFRLYGPDKTFFDKSWKMNDIELVN
ncbi:hypothetical protein C8C83_4928 [Flavobacterium sp. 90]|uniref:DUF1254 domain-containing protein n=1 Tax=unclassified Flavobacterium TaxID=196869 RepID=UPI000EB5820B|nr:MULTISPECIES: DUF1254 domain-containing protein [unclassified Flavobacterium]RKR05575.1 hypothetical protein C8C82_5270 [Flavobacterium sp. 81]TCK56890.1 hypothetical protein C8C83_4928 [Flavobacterium sp. 90]